MYVCMYEYMYPYERASRFHGSVRMCACARAGVVCPSVQMCVCIDACSSRHVRMPRCAHAHAHRRLHLRSSVAHTLVHARMDGYACVFRWLGIDGRAPVLPGYVYVYIYIYSDVYIPIIYLCCTYMHACMHVGMYGHVAHTGIDECVYWDRCHCYRTR